ncbi:unnamed protein product [Ilex paraguariensis]|uniref:Uncharacterized protein n=1 Tax=Ilex paraguariensis TaxID=185542 RepID=A0ABC8V5P3_9AQUA
MLSFPSSHEISFCPQTTMAYEDLILHTHSIKCNKIDNLYCFFLISPNDKPNISSFIFKPNISSLLFFHIIFFLFLYSGDRKSAEKIRKKKCPKSICFKMDVG